MIDMSGLTNKMSLSNAISTFGEKLRTTSEDVNRIAETLPDEKDELATLDTAEKILNFAPKWADVLKDQKTDDFEKSKKVLEDIKQKIKDQDLDTWNGTEKLRLKLRSDHCKAMGLKTALEGTPTEIIDSLLTTAYKLDEYATATSEQKKTDCRPNDLALSMLDVMTTQAEEKKTEILEDVTEACRKMDQCDLLQRLNNINKLRKLLVDESDN